MTTITTEVRRSILALPTLAAGRNTATTFTSTLRAGPLDRAETGREITLHGRHVLDLAPSFVDQVVIDLLVGSSRTVRLEALSADLVALFCQRARAHGVADRIVIG